MPLLPSPAAFVEITRYAVGQVVETAATLATVPFRVLGLLGQTELLVSRMTMLAESAEALVGRVDGVVDGIESTLRETKVIMAAAALAVDEVTATAARAALVVDGASATVKGAAAAVTGASAIVADAGQITGAASGVVRQASATSAEARELLDGYAPALRRAAPLAVRFIEELTPEEVTAAIRMIDELPRLRRHLTEDVMPLLGKLDQVGPDLHSLLEVTNDLHLAIIGLPGLKMLRRRGEERVAEDDATNGR
ncbi:hypothetical protein GCM10020358_21930 [Amorphoplanes nipponensis]|uniref:Ribulose 1,5-bisphosphate carboxylase large subunit n=1 Tax=Actinoplanes nipponensis TaxID=135950 RepID=A0A919JC15_9ACTN|nr:hypothetical protein [Actinoplanes nipponensis]GIE47968.1 hypothetical protein Ani05nite_15020 [Actinoplanes nipponensis]